MSSRESREVLVADKSNEDFLLKGFDAKKFGSANDPCFGKLYSIKASECQNCGDSEFCSVVFSKSILKNKKKDTTVYITDGEEEMSKKEKAFYKKMLKKHSEKKAKFLTSAKFKPYKK